MRTTTSRNERPERTFALDGGRANFRASFLQVADLVELAPQWRSLFDRACDPNPFLGPDFLAPLVTRLEQRHHIRALTLWQHRADHDPSLAALMLYQRRPRLPLVAAPVVECFTHPFVANATPLIQADETEAAAAALLQVLADRHDGSILSLPLLHLDGAVARALTAAAAAAGRASNVAFPVERAAVRADRPSAAYLSERVGGKRLRELRRCERRLSEAGRLTMRTLPESEAAAGLAAFLRLEGAGWKGRRGTALSSTPSTLAFAQEALVGGTAPASLIDVLELDGVAIAAAVHLVAGQHAVAFKCAYDEHWSQGSPGALLDLHTLRLVLDGSTLEVMDSGAVPGHPVGALWRDHIRFGQMLIGLSPNRSDSEIKAYARWLEQQRAWKSTARSAIEKMRRLRDEFRARLTASDGRSHPGHARDPDLSD